MLAAVGRLFKSKGDDEEEEEEKDEFENVIPKESFGTAFRHYVAYLTEEEKYEKTFDIWEDSIPVLKKIYWIQTRQFKIDYGYDFKMDLSHVKEYYAPASQALLAVCKGAGTRAYMVVELLMQGADPNVMEERSENRPIHYLCRRGNLYGVKYLVEAGADYFALNAGHRNALLCATDTSRTGNQIRLVRYLLSLPGYIYKLEVRDSGNNTAAINAIFHQNVWMLRLLLLAGARVTDEHLLDAGQASAFHIAQWTYSASILSDVDQLPVSAIRDLNFEQSNCWYRWTSLKGHYTYSPLLFSQTLWKYGQELCYRMCMQKKIVEDREPKIAKPKTESRMMADELALKKERKRMKAEIKAAKKLKKEQKLVSRELGNEVRELDEWNHQRELLAQKVDAEFSKHLRGKEDNSAVEWVRREISELKKKRQESAAAKSQSAARGASSTPGSNVGSPSTDPVEWETRLKVGSHYITAAPPLPKTKFSKIPLTKMLEQRHNRTHDGNQAINITVPAAEFYLRASWVERDKPPEPEKKLPERLAPKYPTNTTPDGEKWRLAQRSDLGLVDHETRWAKLKMSTPIVIPPNSDSDEGSDSDSDYSDISDKLGVDAETKSPTSPPAIKSFSSPKET